MADAGCGVCACLQVIFRTANPQASHRSHAGRCNPAGRRARLQPDPARVAVWLAISIRHTLGMRPSRVY